MAAALTAGGADNVTVVVVDVLNDGIADAARRRLLHRAAILGGTVIAVVALSVLLALALVRSEWYLGANGDTVGLYRGISGEFLGIPTYELVGTSSVELSDLPTSVQDQLTQGIRVESEEAGRAVIDSYHDQINAEKDRAAEIAENASSEGDAAQATPEGGDQQ